MQLTTENNRANINDNDPIKQKGGVTVDKTLFNDSIKESFLMTYDNEATRDYYRRIFWNTSIMETKEKRDVFDFTFDQIEKVLSALNPATPQSSEKNGRVLSAYINWAIENGHRKDKVNLLSYVKKSSWFAQFVTNDIRTYFSENDLRNIEGRCENYNDSVILRLLFEGVDGKEACKIRNLKKSDVNPDNNTIVVTNESGVKSIFEVSKRLINMLEKAISENTYVKRNGKMIMTDNVRPFTDLIENDYVLRNSITRTTNNNEPIDKSVIYRRVKLISETLGIPNLTTKNIVRSGIIHLAKKLLDQDKELGKDQYIKIAKKFSIVNWYTIKSFCNESVIRELYPEPTEEVDHILL